MSIDLEKHPVRFDSQATQVELGLESKQDIYVEHISPVHPDRRRHSDESSFAQAGSTEDLPRFSFGEASRRRSGVPNLRGASPIPGSHPEFQQQYGNTPWNCADPRRYDPPQKGDAWQKCHALTEKYDNEMCDAWKEEVDKLLIFAGLFSATVTAFSIESYKWLSEGADDVSVRLLGLIATQQLQLIAAATSNRSTSTSTQPTPTHIPQNLLLQPFTVTASSVRINVAWFLSLTLALSTVFIGILCLQWLREYQRDPALPHKEAVALRQMRYEGLLHWKVPQILSMLPVLLQSSLILFFMGLLDLLWSLGHFFVAGTVSAAVGVVMLFLAATTALPAMQHAFTKDRHLRVPQCPYKSPQSWLFYCAGHILFWVITFFDLPWSEFNSPRFHRLLKSAGDLDWLNFDLRWRQFRDADVVVRGAARTGKDLNLVLSTGSDLRTNLAGGGGGGRPNMDLVHALQWLNTTFSQNVEEAICPIYHTLSELDASTAAKAVSGLYLNGQIDDATLRVMLDDRFSPLEEQKRDVISAYYLHLHQDAPPFGHHPTMGSGGGGGGLLSLKAAYVEKVLRILNSQEVPQPFYDWLSEILQEMAVSLSFSSSSSLASSSLSELGMGITPEMNVQILLCIKQLLPRKYGLQTHDVVVAWALLHRLLSPILQTAPVHWRKRNRAITSEMTNTHKAGSDSDAAHHLKLACAMFEELEGWVGRGKEIGRLERVKLCAEGMLVIFSPPPPPPPSGGSDGDLDLEWMESLCAGATAAGGGGQLDDNNITNNPMSKAHSLLCTLQAHMVSLGGVGSVLSSEEERGILGMLGMGWGRSRNGWWLDRSEAFSERDWERLLHLFDRFAPEGWVKKQAQAQA